MISRQCRELVQRLAMRSHLALGINAASRHPGQVSLNRSEDALFDYLRAHADEERFWRSRVVELERASRSANSRAMRLANELREYALERGRANPSLEEALGAGRVSMINLAEYLLRVWTTPAPRPKKRL